MNYQLILFLYLTAGLVVSTSFLVWNWGKFDAVKGVHFGYQMVALYVAIIVLMPFWPIICWLWRQSYWN